MNLIKDSNIEKFNYGLNKRKLNNNYHNNYEIDIVMRALNIVPEDP